MTAKLLFTTLACGASLCLLQQTNAQTSPSATPAPGACPCPAAPPSGPGHPGPRAGGFHGPHGPGEVLEHLTRELNLSDDQKAKIGPILEESAPLIQMIREDAAAKVKAVVNGVAAQVRPMLNSDQEKKFETILERVKAMHGPEGPMGPMGGPMGNHMGRGAGPMGGHAGPMGNPVERLTHELGLNSDQQAKLKSIAESVGPQLKALHEDTSLSPEERHNKVKSILENAESQLRPALTPEQGQKLDEIKAKWHEHAQRPPQPPQGSNPPPPEGTVPPPPQ